MRGAHLCHVGLLLLMSVWVTHALLPVCPNGTWGLDCSETCHCLEDTCDHVNGDCASKQCHPDWTSTACQIRLPKLSRTPIAKAGGCNNIIVEWDAFNVTFDLGTGPIGRYDIWARKDNSSGRTTVWQRVKIVIADDTSSYSVSVTTGLDPDQLYYFRVDAVGLDYGKNRSEISQGAATEEVALNYCTITTTPLPPTTTPYLTSRELFDACVIRVANTGDLDVLINWIVKPEFAHLEFDVNITQQFLGNGDCDDAPGNLVSNGPFDISLGPSPGLAFRGLISWARYEFTVKAVSKVMDVSEVVSQVVTTKSAAPSGIVTDLNFTRVTDTEVDMVWGPVPCDQRKGPFRYYKVLVNSLPYLINSNRFQRSSLEPFTTYNISLSYVNDNSEGPSSEIFSFTTAQGAPSKVEILSVSFTYNTITVNFQPPVKPNGILASFTLVYSESNNFLMSEAVTRSATPASSTITARRLNSETSYYVYMFARTEAKSGAFSSVEQVKTLPAPPPTEALTLTLGSRTTECLTVEWKPPDMAAGNITDYVFEIRRATAEETITPTPLQIDSSMTSYSQCDLQPSSLYFVTISARVNGTILFTNTTDFSTSHGTPPKPPVVQFVRSGYTNITVAIQPVVAPFITAYRIQVALVNTTSLTEGAKVTQAELRPQMLTERREFVFGDGQTYGGFVNEPLQPYSYYNVYLVALSTMNNITTSNFSVIEAAVRTVPFDPAVAPPLNLEVNAKTTSCLTLTWEMPEAFEDITTTLNLVVEKISDDSVLSTVVISRSLNGSERMFEVCGLATFSQYTAKLTAFSATTQLSTGSGIFRTEHSAPGRPAPPIFINSTSTTINIAIEPYVMTGGPLTRYEIKVEEMPDRKKRSALCYLSPLCMHISDETKHERHRRAAGVPGDVYVRLNKTQVTQRTVITVGDGRVVDGITNSELTPNALYTVHYVVVSEAGNQTKVNYSSLDPPRRAYDFAPTPAPPIVSEEEDNGGLIAAVVILIIVIIIIILLIILYWWWQRRNRFNPYEIHDDDSTVTLPPERDDYDAQAYWSPIYNIKDSRFISVGRNLVYAPGSHKFIEPVVNPDQQVISFKNEFQSLPHKPPSRATDNIARRNKRLNRFPHLLPYDHSLVQLKPDVQSESTYVNASYIPGYKKTPAYIAAQSPFDQRTVLDFWRLIYQRSIKTVVMITNVVEDQVVKCSQYWPDQDKASMGHFLLELVDTTEFADYIIRTVSVSQEGQEEKPRTVRLFEFTSWPDHGVPDDPIPFLEMRNKVRRYHHDEQGPILVHCGTGVARTGVFVAVDALIDQYAFEGKAAVFDLVRRIRKDRPYMVRTLKQYVFIYEALFEEFHAGDTLVDFDMKERYHHWTGKNPHTGRTYLRDQFELLETFSRGPRRQECKTALLEVNIPKNRYIDVVPADQHRPTLQGPTDYVNALFLDGYLNKNQFIVTQTPLHTTILDMWKLVHQHDVRTIIMVENPRSLDDTCAQYWPDSDLKQLEPFFIQTIASYQQENVAVKTFKVRSTETPSEAGKLVRQFQFPAWAQAASTPASKTQLLDLLDLVFAWQEEACSNTQPVMVHCQDGASHSGMFVALALACERMEEDGEIDVYRTIKHIKRRRPQFVMDYEQFRFCYKSVWDFMNLRMPGGTFTDTLGQSKMDKMYGVASLNLSSMAGTGFDNLDLHDTTEL